jgi:lipoyl(octanoyl) transferase
VSPERWRLIESPGAAGAWNMAVDEALLDSCTLGQGHFPCLRLYSWTPPALSLGYHQVVEGAVAEAALAALGIDLVRRPTGGRAVLHEEEVTYGVVAACHAGVLVGPVMQSYRIISEALVAALRGLGLDASLSAGDPPGGAGLAEPCFARRSRCEVEVEGFKVIGSVQLRRGGCLLQHGSIPLRVDPRRLQRATGRAAEGMRGLEDVMGGPLKPVDVSRALLGGFERRFSIALEPAPLTAWELSRAGALARQRYQDPGWTRNPPRRREPLATPLERAS